MTVGEMIILIIVFFIAGMLLLFSVCSLRGLYEPGA